MTRAAAFRLAVIASLALLASAITARAQEPPPNDNILNTHELLSPEERTSAFDATTAGATTEPGETAPCAQITSTVWYSFATSTNARVAIDVRGAYGPVLAAYTLVSFLPSPPGGGSLANVGCTTANAEGLARLTFDTVPGERYYVQLGGAGSSGPFSFTLACDPACVPPNDDAVNAHHAVFDLEGNNAVTGATQRQARTNTDAATLEAGEPQPCGAIGKTVWYWVSFSQPARVDVDTRGSNFDTVLAVYSQSTLVPSPPGALTEVSCNDDAEGVTSALSFDMQPNTAYYIQVGGKEGASGDLTFNFLCDRCLGAIAPIDTGDGTGQGGSGLPPGIPQPSGPVRGPDTGSGGYR